LIYGYIRLQNFTPATIVAEANATVTIVLKQDGEGHANPGQQNNSRENT
jgi:hypothetical protein